MDKWGPAECRARRDYIAEKVWDRAKQFYDGLSLSQKATLLRRWETSIAAKMGVVAMSFVNPESALRNALVSVIDESIADAEVEFPVAMAGISTASGCCCFCQGDGCSPAGACGAFGLTNCPAPNGSLTCFCVHIEAVSPECACIEGDYTIMNSIFTTHTWGLFLFDDPCSDQTFFTITMDDSATMADCPSGCGSNENFLRIVCSADDGVAPTTWCGMLCGEDDPFNMQGEFNVCCGCIRVTVTEGAC